MSNLTEVAPVRKQPAVQAVRNRTVVLDGKIYMMELVEELVSATFDLLLQPRRHRKEPHRILRVVSKRFSLSPDEVTGLLAVFGEMYRRAHVTERTNALNGVALAEDAKRAVLEELAS
jgi:hypothetical protein